MHTKVRTPKKLKWNEITQSLTWNLQDINPPKPIEKDNQVSNILEHSDGSIDITFDNNELPRHSISNIIQNNRASTSSSYIGGKTLKRSQSMKLRGIDFTKAIPKGLYDENSNDSQYDPIKSDMENYSELND